MSEYAVHDTLGRRTLRPKNHRISRKGLAVHACVPDLEFREIGKPGIEMLNMVLNASRSGPDATVLVGDNPSTDGEGASRMGLNFFQTGTGHFTLMELLFSEPR